jgi:hypothetical protein
VTDWLHWHDRYDQPTSWMSVRLGLVRERLRQALDACPPGPVSIVSACAGQGRDVLGVVPHHPRGRDVRALLVELDEGNVAVARQQAASAGAAVEVRQADAGQAAAYADGVPADIVLMCGVFGNISDADIRTTVAALPELCAPDAWVLWTRHREPPDLTPSIRGWFADAGFDEVAFDGPAELAVGVGTHRLAVEPKPFQPGRRLFEFR